VLNDHGPDLLLRGAPVYDAGRWSGDCLLVSGGRIAARGTYDDVAPLVGPATEELDLTGSWLLPAFHDAHVHPVSAGMEMVQCDLTGEETVDGYLRRVAKYAEQNPDRPWITGGGWSMGSFPRGVPSAALLDRICPDRPVYLPNRDHHSAWVNSRALELAGITSATPDPVDGRIERDASGSPVGALHEGAMALVGSLVPPPGEDELLQGLLTAQEFLHSLGIVGWQDALVGEGLGMRDALPTYLRATHEGLLTATVVGALWWDRERGLEQVDDLVARRRQAHEAGFRATSVKIMQDGVCETLTAAVLEPYLDASGNPSHQHGLSFIEPAALKEYVARLDALDFQVHVHALGDRAVRDSLDAVEHAVERNGRRGNRHHLAHLQIVHPDDVPRFAELDVVANVQPLWACLDEEMTELTLPFLAPSARERQYVFRSLLAAGARLAFGSDWPVSTPDPFACMHVAVNRREPGAAAAEPLLPQEGLTVVEALHAATAGSAYVNGLEASSGALEVGRSADVVAVDRDVLAVPLEGLHEVSVRHTFARGVHVFGG
jgi:predicted amidohydrolase YtcJ